MAAVVVPVLFLLLLALCGGLVVLYLRHRRLQNNFTAFANSHYNSRLGSAIFSSGDELGEKVRILLQLLSESEHEGSVPAGSAVHMTDEREPCRNLFFIIIIIRQCTGVFHWLVRVLVIMSEV